MKTMTVLYGIFLAAAFAIAAPIAVIALHFVFQSWIAFRIVISGAVIAYAVLLLPRSERKSGRIFALVSAVVLEGLLFFAAPALGIYIIGSAGVVWLTRSMLFGRSILHICCEGFLAAGALFCGVLAASATGSLAISIWSAMLVLAAGSMLPGCGRPVSKPRDAGLGSRFERAHHSAEQALEALYSRP